MDIIQDREMTPDMESIDEYITGDAQNRWRNLIAHIENEFKSKPQIVYSTCSGKPGWNVKFKKGGKALCTLYPEKESFVALVVLNGNEMDLFTIVRSDYTQYVNALFDHCKPFNGTKWLMISVSDNSILTDVKKLLHLKTPKK